VAAGKGRRRGFCCCSCVRKFNQFSRKAKGLSRGNFAGKLLEYAVILQHPLNAAANDKSHVPFPRRGLLKSQSIITQSVLRQFHSLFQSEFSRECKLVLPLSSYSIFSFPEGRRVAAYAFFLVCSSLLSFLQ
jgi:hypothetical protein